METKFRCRNCEWEGLESELDFEKVESCSGPDQIDICPRCGSINLLIVKEKETPQGL